MATRRFYGRPRPVISDHNGFIAALHHREPIMVRNLFVMESPLVTNYVESRAVPSSSCLMTEPSLAFPPYRETRKKGLSQAIPILFYKSAVLQVVDWPLIRNKELLNHEMMYGVVSTFYTQYTSLCCYQQPINDPQNCRSVEQNLFRLFIRPFFPSVYKRKSGLATWDYCNLIVFLLTFCLSTGYSQKYLWEVWKKQFDASQL